MLIACCPACAEKLRQTYWITETEETPRMGWCRMTLPMHWSELTQYEATPQSRENRKIYRQSRGGPPRKDGRAYYREPWQSGME